MTAEGIKTHRIYSGKNSGDPIPVEKSQAHFLLVHGCDDQTYHYSHTFRLADRLKLVRGTTTINVWSKYIQELVMFCFHLMHRCVGRVLIRLWVVRLCLEEMSDYMQ